MILGRPRTPAIGLGALAILCVGMAAPPADAPRLAGAVERAPEWLTGAPYDVAAFFAAPRPDQNAAPLYLEAFAEFFELGPSNGVLGLRPPRPGSLREKTARCRKVYDAWSKDPASVPAAEVDRCVADYAAGLRKIEAAQARPRCVFQVGITYETSVSQAEAARIPARVLALAAGRDLDRGQVDRAIDRLSALLRLSRDLRPRGILITQHVAAGIDALGYEHILNPILRVPKLKASQCDRIAGLLRAHGPSVVGGFATAIEADHVLLRGINRAFETGVRLGIDADGRAVERRLDADGLARYVLEMRDPDDGGRGGPIDAAKIAACKAMIRGTEAEQVAGRVLVDDLTRAMLGVRSAPYRGQKAAFDGFWRGRVEPLGPESRVLIRPLLPPLGGFLLAHNRSRADLAAAEARVALRRWRIEHGADATDLAEAARAVGLGAGPIDPFADAPMRLARGGAGPVVYSVGPDGVDDGARVDAGMVDKPGDYLWPMPAPASR